jgi:proteic killer suppression protein
VIRTFRIRALADLWSQGTSRKIDARLHERIIRRLDALDKSLSAEEMNIPGFDFHSLRGFRPTRYTIHVNGPWCITFEFHDGDAFDVDLEQYH